MITVHCENGCTVNVHLDGPLCWYEILAKDGLTEDVSVHRSPNHLLDDWELFECSIIKDVGENEYWHVHTCLVNICCSRTLKLI